VAGALLVAHEDVTDRRVDDRVVDRQDGASGKAEGDLDAGVFEAADECLGSSELHGGRSTVGCGLETGQTKNLLAVMASEA
jgi:hypothetical protein